jgi:hypothetical protein
MTRVNPAMNESEKTEHRLSLRQADAARADLYAIHDELISSRRRSAGCRPAKTSRGSPYFRWSVGWRLRLPA